LNFNQPVALAVSAKGELLISDSQNHAVKVGHHADVSLDTLSSPM